MREKFRSGHIPSFTLAICCQFTFKLLSYNLNAEFLDYIIDLIYLNLLLKTTTFSFIDFENLASSLRQFNSCKSPLKNTFLECFHFLHSLDEITLHYALIDHESR